MEGSRTRPRRGRGAGTDQYSGLHPHGQHRRTRPAVRSRRDTRRRHQRRRPRKPRDERDGTPRWKIRFRPALDRHVAQRTQRTDLRRPRLRLLPQDGGYFGHLVPQGDTDVPQVRRHRGVGFGRGADLHSRPAHAVRLQRHGRRQSDAPSPAASAISTAGKRTSVSTRSRSHPLPRPPAAE